MADTPTHAQIRGARAMLDWSIAELALAARVSVSTVKRAEDDSGRATSEDLIGQIQGALETEGVLFLANDGAGAGLRLRAGLRSRRRRHLRATADRETGRG